MITEQTIADYLNHNQIELVSTHKRLCLPIINRIYKKMKLEVPFMGIKVVENTIIDGHHRYIASLFAKNELEQIPYQTTSAKTMVEWNDIEFVNEDWDTEAKIRLLNQQDAEYSGIPVDEIVKYLK